MAGVISWPFISHFNEDPKSFSATPFCTWPHFYKIIPSWTEIKELFPSTGGWKTIRYKELRSQHMQSPPHAASHASPSTAGRSATLDPSLVPSPSCCTPHPTWKSCFITGYYLTLILQSTPTVRVFSDSPKYQLRHLYLGFVCPTSSRR